MNQNHEKVCGKYSLLPNKTGVRIAEGGRRVTGVINKNYISTPLVSVITVALNSEKTIENTIRSVINQTYSNIEYIIIDGASSDSTLAIIKKYQEKIDYFVSEPDDGLYHAINKGISLANGEFILVLNSDDWYEKDCITRLYNAYVVSCADFVSALARRVDNNGKEVDILPSMPYDDSIRFGMSLRHELMFVPAKIYNALGYYNIDFKIISDFEFAIRLYNQGLTVYEIHEPLLNFRITGVSNTNWNGLVNEHYQLLLKQFPEISESDLKLLSDPKKYNAELINKMLLNYSSHVEFVDSLISYGYRRNFFNLNNKPPLSAIHNPLISIIIPVYNSKNTIRKCLDSIITQELKSIEIICVDDSSTDGTPDIIKEYTTTDKRIIYICNDTNKGVSASRNIGMDNASGKYLMFVDSDDMLAQGALQELLITAEENNCDMVKGAFEKIYAGETIICGKPDKKDDKVTTLNNSQELLKNTEGFWSYLYKKSFLNNMKFVEHLKTGEDSLFLICALVRAKRIAWKDTVVYRYFIHPDSAMSNLDYQKYKNAIEWRERAWRIFKDQGYPQLAEWCISRYWSENYFKNMKYILDGEQYKDIQNRLKAMIKKTGLRPIYFKHGYWLQGISDFIAQVCNKLNMVF